MESGSMPLVVPLAACSDPRAGGKAVHLSKLFGAGLRVPDGFVLVGAGPESLPEGIDEAYTRLGGPVAVRSSAIGEDSVDASFAGQYDTFLGIEGTQAVIDAAIRCLASAHAARADAYRDAMNAHPNATMSVIVQRMVDARAAGVLFTRNPVTGAEDQVVIEATRGLGEALVSGHVAAHRMVLSRDGVVLSNDTQGVEASIEPDLAKALVRDALLAEKHFGYPLDMEWAVDRDGVIHWLQARPITTTNLPGIDEFDTNVDGLENGIFTTYNVGEVLPGAATPLGGSFMIECINDAMRELNENFGIPRERLEGIPITVQFSGHIFLHLNPMYLVPLYVLGTKNETLDFSLAGRSLERVDLGAPAPLPIRAFNVVRYFSHLLQARKRLEAFLVRTASFDIVRAKDPVGFYRKIDAAIPLVNEAMSVHLHTSSLASALQSILLGIIAGGDRPNAEHQATFSGLLAFVDLNDPDASTSSLGLAQAMDHVVSIFAAHPEDAKRISTLSLDDALEWLRSGDCAAPVRRAFEEFLEHHGHRCVREVEIHQKDWREDPRPFLANVQAILASSQGTMPARQREPMQLPPMPLAKRFIAERVVAASRSGLVLRERSKSHAVRLLRKLRPAYLELARMLVDAKTLPDTDLIFFVTHQELAKLVEQHDPAIVRRALHRRRLHPQKMALQFPCVSKGKPQPIEEEVVAASTTEVMHGTPVSRGVVVGLARVARSPEEAKAIEPGEILVVPYTDVGWAPYFLRAAGLASEIGGTLSHGAVVARECGLPAIVNLPGATKRFRTGDKLRLDGNTGELRLITSAA